MLDNSYFERNYIKNKLNYLDKLIIYLFAGYFVLTPFYLWSSGLPQLADIFLITSLLLYLMKNNFKLQVNSYSKKVITILCFFLIWITTINLAWIFLLQETDRFLYSTLFYTFNIVITIFTISLFTQYKEKIFIAIFKGSILSLIIQFLYLVISGGFAGVRITLSFNNPNQLAYYGLLISGMIIFIGSELNLKSEKIIIGLTISFILIIFSLSNAAIISWLFLFFFYVISRQTTRSAKRKIFMITIIIIVVVIIIYNTSTIIQNNNFYQTLINRLSQTTEKIDNSGSIRGYDRIINYPKYWFLGAGEGAQYRFASLGLELHSTLGTIQFSYGIVGTILFMSVLFSSLYRDKFQYWYIIMAILIYGLSHNGLRNSIFWILLGLLIGYENLNKNNNLRSKNG